MDAFDSSILLFLNRAARVSFHFDRFMALSAENSVLRGGVVMALFWAFWFKPDPRQVLRRERLFTTVVAGFVAFVVARVLQLLLPFRLRPLHDADLALTLPWSAHAQVLGDWSAMPSDHAALYIAFAAGAFFVSRALGWIVLIHSFVIILLPRLYLGFHYPTDLLAGAVLGTAIVCLMQSRALGSYIGRFGAGVAERFPASFYAAAFIVTLSAAEMGGSLRSLGGFGADVVRQLWLRLS